MRVLVNPPWYFYSWLGGWLAEYAKGCELVVVVPFYKGYNRVVEAWPGMEWERKIALPRTLGSWFADGGERRVGLPSWGCEVWVGRVRG
jgi:hypothetical protein